MTYTASKTGPVVTRTCSFTVTVTDNQLPVINGCLGNISTAMTAGQCGAVVNFTPPTATDNCGGSVSLVRTDGTGLNSGSLFPVGVTTIGYLATDAAGNTSTCSFTITVLPDDQPPVITCVSSPQSVCATAGNPYLKTGVDWDASVTENCAGAVTKTYSLTGVTSGTGTSLNNVEFNVGITTVTWTATDNNGNSSPCSFDVEVTQAPSITTNPVNQSTCLNGSATFTVVATGTPLPTFQWRKTM
ncbi:MAG: HYR domain-containing protein [Draconibacterium sp.]|nr:HYR domain-containing protein [Draconibacterium sp.]